MKSTKNELLKVRITEFEKDAFKYRVKNYSKALYDFIKSVNEGDIEIIKKYFKNN